MKISRPWLQRYFEQELPSAAALEGELTFHAFEIESVENDILDVKVTANRGHDCLSHRGIAKELSAILEIPLKRDPLREKATLEPAGKEVSVSIKEPELCGRYIAAYIRGVTVGPSPQWLATLLETIGQRSINNIVDATNFVMFDLGQPLHAFDAGELTQRNGTYAISVRRAKEKEKLVALDDKVYELSPADLLIVDAHADVGIGIAGVKGGKPAGVSEKTRDIIIEAAQFDGPSVRKTAQRLKLRTDASARFEQVISPEVAAPGMRAAIELILQLAGGEVADLADEYPNKVMPRKVSASAKHINDVLGTQYAETEIARTLQRLDLPSSEVRGDFTVSVPYEREDLTMPEDLAEEIGRIIGYDNVPTVELPDGETKPEVNPNFNAAEQVREELVSQGFSEVFTSVFSEQGDRMIANKIDGVRPYLRRTITLGLIEAHEKNVRNKDLFALRDVKLFEIGTVWQNKEERTMLAKVVKGKRGAAQASEEPLAGMEASAYERLPTSTTRRYAPFSKYPFIVRDLALWVPKATSEREMLDLIRAKAGGLLVTSYQFDRFLKDGRLSLAFRLVFQSFDKTLTDLDANERMESIASALTAAGYEVR